MYDTNCVYLSTGGHKLTKYSVLSGKVQRINLEPPDFWQDYEESAGKIRDCLIVFQPGIWDYERNGELRWEVMAALVEDIALTVNAAIKATINTTGGLSRGKDSGASGDLYHRFNHLSCEMFKAILEDSGLGCTSEILERSVDSAGNNVQVTWSKVILSVYSQGTPFKISVDPTNNLFVACYACDTKVKQAKWDVSFRISGSRVHDGPLFTDCISGTGYTLDGAQGVLVLRECRYQESEITLQRWSLVGGGVDAFFAEHVWVPISKYAARVRAPKQFETLEHKRNVISGLASGDPLKKLFFD